MFGKWKEMEFWLGWLDLHGSEDVAFDWFFLRHLCPMDYWNGIKKKISNHQTVSFGEGSREWQLLRRLAIVVISQFDFYSIQSRYYKPLSICFSSDIEWWGGGGGSTVGHAPLDQIAWQEESLKVLKWIACDIGWWMRCLDVSSWFIVILFFASYFLLPLGISGLLSRSEKKTRDGASSVAVCGTDAFILPL
jgi:hypothetical protein